MTRAQIVEMTTETDRRISANETGVAPFQAKHAKRFAELKQREDLANEISRAMDRLTKKRA
jgi:hypothetical protein